MDVQAISALIGELGAQISCVLQPLAALEERERDSSPPWKRENEPVSGPCVPIKTSCKIKLQIPHIRWNN